MTGGPRALRVSGHGARRSVLALAAAALLATAPSAQEPAKPAPPTGQDAPPIELGPAIRDETNGFELCPIAGATPDAKQQPWEKLVYRVAPAHRGGLIIVGLFAEGMTPEKLLGLLRKDYAAAGWTVVEEAVGAAAGAGCDARIQSRRDRDGASERSYLYGRHGHVWRLMIYYGTRDEALWARRTAAMLPTFKILGPPIDPAAAPALEGGTPYDSATWGLAFPLPKGATLDASVPVWAALTWKLSYATNAFGYLNVGFSEPGESPRTYRRGLLRLFEDDGFSVLREVVPPERPAGVDALVILQRGKDGETLRLALWLRPTWSCAFAFAHAGSGERAWDRFTRQVLAAARVTGPTRALPMRLSGSELEPPAPEQALGATLRLPKGRVVVPPDETRLQRTWDVSLPNGWTPRLTITRGDDGETVEDLVDAYFRGHETLAVLRGREVRFNALLGTAGFMQMDETKRKFQYHFHYFEHGGRPWCVSLGCAPWQAVPLERMFRGVLLGFRGTAAVDARFAAPEGPVHETAGILVQTEPKQATPKLLKECAETAQSAVDAARELLQGPPPAAKLRIHVYSPEEMVRRLGKGLAATFPQARYLPEGRVILVQAPAGKLDAKLALELQRSAFSAYRDGWLGTPYGLPPWIVAGLEETLRLAKRAGPVASGESDLKRSPLADWIRKNRKTATWPVVERLVRASRPVEGEAERAYALALLLACGRAEAPAAKGLVGTIFARFQARGDPQEAMDDAYDGVDFGALDAAARALLAELK